MKTLILKNGNFKFTQKQIKKLKNKKLKKLYQRNRIHHNVLSAYTIYANIVFAIVKIHK